MVVVEGDIDDGGREQQVQQMDGRMKAMAQALPDRVIATGFDCTTAFCLSHLGEKGYSVYLEIFGGGYGASRGADGCDAVDSPLSNCSNAPVESLDIDYDFFRIVGYELAPDSFGLGARRGGAGEPGGARAARRLHCRRVGWHTLVASALPC